MDSLTEVRGATELRLSHKIIAVFMSFVLALGLSPIGQVPAKAYADEGDSADDAAVVDAIAAPVVDWGINKNKQTNLEDASGLQVVSEVQSAENASPVLVNVTVTADALPKHYNANGAYAYWAGIAVPYSGTDYTFDWNYGAYNESESVTTKSVPEGRTITKGKTIYTTFYWGNDAPFSNETGYVAVYKGSKAVAVYSINFSGVTCVGDAVAAPLTAAFQPEGYAITQTTGDGAVNVVYGANEPLKKHVQGTGGAEQAYWIGLGVPYTKGETIELGYGEYSAGVTVNVTGTATKDYPSGDDADVYYTTAYFDNAKVTKDNQGAWLRVKSGNEVVGVYKITSNIENSSKVSIAETEHGTVTATGVDTDGFATQGDDVLLNVEANKGYSLKEITVKDANGAAVNLVDNAFTMPATDVTVTATFEKDAENASPVLAPVVARTADGAAELEDGDYTGLFAIGYTVSGKNVAVDLEANELPKHYNAAGMYAYWAGIAVPYADGYKYATGFDKIDPATATFNAEGNIYEVNGKTYRAFYAGTLSTFAGKVFHIAVKDGSDNLVAIYDVDLSGVKCAGDAAIAPIRDRGEKVDKDDASVEPEDWAIAQEKDGIVTTVTLEGTGLAQHYNGQGNLGYWAGIAVPWLSSDDTTYYYAFGDGEYEPGSSLTFNESATLSSVSEPDYVVGENTTAPVKCTSVYFRNDNLKANGGQFFAIAKKSDQDYTPVAVYQIKTDMTNKSAVKYEAAAGGTIAGPETAIEGQNVTVTATPDATHAFAGLVVKDAKGNETKVAGNTFKMAYTDVTVTPLWKEKQKQTITFTAKSPATVKVGGKLALGAKASGGAAVTYTTSSAAIATVDASGNVTGVKEGKATITVKAAGNANYLAATATFEVIVEAATPTAGEKVTGANAGTGVTADATVNADGKSVTLTKATTTASTVKIDTVTVDGVAVPVTKVAANALKGSKAKSITVGDSVTELGANALANTKKLTSLTIGKGVKKVGKNVLKGSKVKKVTLKSSKLNKKNFKNLFKKSKVKMIKLKGVSKKVKKNYKKWAKALKIKVK